MNVIVPSTAWWLDMLQIFVPVATALGLALLGARQTLRSSLRAKGAEARLDIQRQALDEMQQALKTFWIATAKLMRITPDGRLQNTVLLAQTEEAGATITVAHSRLQDQKLADDVTEWHFETAKKLVVQRVYSRDEVSAEHQDFVALSDRLGSQLRELTTARR